MAVFYRLHQDQSTGTKRSILSTRPTSPVARLPLMPVN